MLKAKQIIKLLEGQDSNIIKKMIPLIPLLKLWVESSRYADPDKLYDYTKSNFPELMRNGQAFRYLLVGGESLIKNKIVSSKSKLSKLSNEQLRLFLEMDIERKKFKCVSWTVTSNGAKTFSSTYSGIHKLPVGIIIRDRVLGVDIEKAYNNIKLEIEPKWKDKKYKKLLTNILPEYFKLTSSDIERTVRKEQEILAPVNYNTIEIEQLWIKG